MPRPKDFVPRTERPGKAVIDRDEYLNKVTGEEELARHEEQFERQEEHQHREHGAVHRAGRPEAIVQAPSRRRAGPVPAAPADATPEQRAEFGLAAPPLPGGIPHIHGEPAERQRLHPKVPGPYYDGIMAHGVPVDVEHPPNHGRISPAGPARHGHETDVVHYKPIETEPDPVPVYVVQRGGGGKSRLATALDSRTAPVAGSDPVRLTSLDLRRARVGLLNEDAAHDARISSSLADLAMGKGVLLSHLATSYLWLQTQDDLWAVGSGANTVAISIITEYDQPGGG